MDSPYAATGSGVMVELKSLTKTYAKVNSEVHALTCVDLKIRVGEHVAIVGPSGSGKSTLMNLLGALDTPTSGRLIVDDCDLSQLDRKDMAAFRNRTVGFIFQQFNLLPDLSALDNVALPLLYRGMPKKERRERAEAILAQLGLQNRLTHRPTELSGGQQQRVAIARALVGEPRLLLADEPTGALDTATSREILSILSALLADGLTLVVVTHDPDVARAAERRIQFQDGAIIADDGGRQCAVASALPS